MSSSTWVCRRQALYLGTEAPGPLPCEDDVSSTTMRSGSGKASGLSGTVLTTHTIAVLAPTPSASADIAVAVKPGLCLSMRNACFRSIQKVSIRTLDADDSYRSEEHMSEL